MTLRIIVERLLGDQQVLWSCQNTASSGILKITHHTRECETVNAE